MRSNNENAIKDANGNLLKDKDDIKDQWKQYVEALYDTERKLLKENIEMVKMREMTVEVQSY